MKPIIKDTVKTAKEIYDTANKPQNTEESINYLHRSILSIVNNIIKIHLFPTTEVYFSECENRYCINILLSRERAIEIWFKSDQSNFVISSVRYYVQPPL